MTSKKEITYLLQVAIPFVILSVWKSLYFSIPVLAILISLPSEYLRRTLIKLWKYLGLALGRIVSPVILSLIYYLFLTPLALIRRLFGSDVLNLKQPESSTLKSVKRSSSLEDFNDLW